MDTNGTATAEGFAGEMRVVPRPPVEGEGSFGLSIVVPASRDGTRWSVFSLEGEWEEVDGDRFLRPVQTAHDVAIGDGAVDGMAPIRNFARNAPSFNTVLHALGRRDYRLQEDDEVRILLDAWLGRSATDEERDLVGRRALDLSSACPAGDDLLSRTWLALFDFATELDGHLIELVTGPNVETVRAACAAFPMLATEIASSEEVVDGLLQEMSIEDALGSGELVAFRGDHRMPLPPMEAHTMAWLAGLRLKSKAWKPELVPYAIELANALEPGMLPRDDAEFDAFVRTVLKTLGSGRTDDDDDWVDYGPDVVRLIARLGYGLVDGRGWIGIPKQWGRVVRRLRRREA